MSWPLVCSSLHRVKTHSWPTTWNASSIGGHLSPGNQTTILFSRLEKFLHVQQQLQQQQRGLCWKLPTGCSKLNGEEHETRQTEVQPPSTGARKHVEKKKSWNAATQPCSTRRTQSLQQFPSYISLAQKMLLPNKQAHRQNKLRRHVTAIGEAGRGKYKSSSVNKWSGGGAGGKRGRLLTGRFNMVTSVKCDSLALLRVDHGCLENWK